MDSRLFALAGLVLTTLAMKSFGPLALGGRRMPDAVTRSGNLLAPALLTALVLVQTFEGSRLEPSPLLIGVGAAGLVLLLRRGTFTAVAVAVLVTAAVRGLSGGGD